MKRNKNLHCNHALHEWCAEKFKKESIKVSKDQEAGKKIIQNALFCLLRSRSADDFLALNAKDSDAIDFPNTATKNDSKSMVFKVINIAFVKVSKKTRKWFENVKNIAVSLDKVSVHRTSFTAITTYFFYQGKIHVILNKLEKMKSEEYSAEGTAHMVVNTLMETLGLTKTQLALVLKHFVYDGYDIMSSLFVFQAIKTREKFIFKISASLK